MKIERLIERIEGEATLLFEREGDGSIRFAEIVFPHFRGMEKILERKEALDALAITPRVCGICGHAHLMATVRALESCYDNAGYRVQISSKAETIRALTLALEMVQNHFKWFYLTLLPSVPGFETNRDASLLAVHRAASLCAKAIAHFAGQWPHTSYALPGGVMCDPTHLELMQVESLISRLCEIFESTLLHAPLETVTQMSQVGELFECEGDLPALLRHFQRAGWERFGQSHDRFIVLSEHLLGPSGKALKTRLASVDLEMVEEGQPTSPQGYTNHAKPVRYKSDLYEAGPLARAMVAKQPLIRQMHRKYKDASMTRIAARVVEIAALLQRCRESIGVIDLNEPSYIEPPVKLSDIEAVQGRGTVEAARGSLIHSLRLRRGKILRYCIVTPTQWNLANGTPEDPGVAQKAMVGLPDETAAEVVFRSFDVCSVCTTQ
ncbi:nickel-dependent hydrogenase large subunit [Hydrogenimonas cancrithermarum]|uniref:Hydrogenase large subunit n=1 Tax=Hydrogenimonas cancrithermarum TaxID=2993563 RepID=A0ABN6WTW0_9BACT|nr:nickel-dependent hydrogenase large subunit [Hydrogenimonas cancrithermarum]BDY12499.1 hydrogenase large subunit [Hydrogenimonas cancrithermarum]